MSTVASAFLSHSKADWQAWRVSEVADLLGQFGILPWIDDTDLRGSGALDPKLGAAIKAQSHFVLFLSEGATKSGWVRREVEAAIAHHGQKRIIIVVEQAQKDARLKAVPGLAFALNLATQPRFVWLDEPEKMAWELARVILDDLAIHKAAAFGILLDQRGKGDRRNEEGMVRPPLLPTDAPMLVFRPDRGPRTEVTMEVGNHWEAFAHRLGRALATTMGARSGGREAYLTGNAQLGLAWLVGRIIGSEKSLIRFHTHQPGEATLHHRWRRDLPPPAPDLDACLDAQTVASGGPAVVLGIGPLNTPYEKNAREWAAAQRPPLPVAWLQTARWFYTQAEAEQLLADTLASIERLAGKVSTIYVVSCLTFHLTALLAALAPADGLGGLKLRFLDYRRDLPSGNPARMYAELQVPGESRA